MTHNKHLHIKNAVKNIKDKKVQQIIEGYLKHTENILFSIRERPYKPT